MPPLQMIGRVPLVKAVMTPFPYSVAVGQSARDAEAMMTQHEIRHLPVKEGDALVGVIRERDVRGARSPEQAVRELMSKSPVIVDLNQPLDTVLLTLVESHQDSALVVRDGRLAGIFTAMDACRLLGEGLHRIAPPPPEEVA